MSIDVGAVDDFINGEVRAVVAGGRELALVRWGEEIFALRAICPHQSASLCGGEVAARMVSEGPGQVAIDESSPVLTCPWHSWEFDLRTGRSVVAGDRFRVASYRVDIAGGRVLVTIGADGLPR